MPSITNILVPLDPEVGHSTAIAHATRMAIHRGASLSLLGVVPELPWFARLALSEPESIESTLQIGEERRLDGIATPIRSEGVPVRIRTVVGRPSLSVVEEAIRGSYDLVIKDAGSVAEGVSQAIDRQILRTCPCPVWLARPRAERAGAHRPRLLALVDPPPLGTSPSPPEDRDSVSGAILDLAALLTESEGFEPIVAHVWDATGQGLLRSCGFTEEQINAYVDTVRSGVTSTLDRLMTPYQDRLGTDCLRLLRGLPTSVIPQFVEQEGIDLVVLGTMGRSGIAGMLIGNTAETIVNRVPCSVLAVKPSGFVSPVTIER